MGGCGQGGIFELAKSFSLEKLDRWNPFGHAQIGFGDWLKFFFDPILATEQYVAESSARPPTHVPWCPGGSYTELFSNAFSTLRK